MTQNTILISVVVCTYNRADILRLCLESLANQTLEKNLYEVIIVDNNSIDSTSETVGEFTKRFSNVQLVHEPNQGISHSRNLGYSLAAGEFVAYIDDDAKARPEWLATCVSSFRNVMPQPVVVGGKIVPYYLSEKPEWFLDEYETRTNGERAMFLTPFRGSPALSGSNMIFRKSILEEYKGFSPAFGPVGDKFRTGEETELFIRIYRDHPYFWYDNTVVVEHLVPDYKMRVSYRVRRSFQGGFGDIKTRFGRINVIAFLFWGSTYLIRILFNLAVLLLTVPWWRKGWQKTFLRYMAPIAACCGMAVSLLELKFRIKILD